MPRSTRANNAVDETLDDMDVVVDVVDKHIATGPIEAAEDALEMTKNDIDNEVEQTKKDMKE